MNVSGLRQQVCPQPFEGALFLFQTKMPANAAALVKRPEASQLKAQAGT